MDDITVGATVSTNEKVARIFRAARKLNGKTQVEVATHLGVSQSCISKIEAGKLLPSVSEWFLFAQFVGIRPDESYHYGYIDHAFPVQLEGLYKDNIFKMPAKYARSPRSKVRMALPFIQHFREQFGDAKWESYLDKEKIDPDFFLVYDGQINLQFTLDLVSRMMESGALKPQNLETLARSARDPQMHGRLQQDYRNLTGGRELLTSLIENMDRYETNFNYQFIDRSAKGLVLAVSPRENLKEIDYKNSTLGDFLCRYKKKYLVEFSSYSGGQPVTIHEKECHFHGSQQCIYQIQTA